MKRNRITALTEGLPPTFWLIWTGTLVNRLGGFVIPFLTLYLTAQRAIPVGRAALIVSLFGAGSFLAQLSGGELTDRMGCRPVMLMSFFVTPVFMIMLGLARDLLLISAGTFSRRDIIASWKKMPPLHLWNWMNSSLRNTTTSPRRRTRRTKTGRGFHPFI